MNSIDLLFFLIFQIKACLPGYRQRPAAHRNRIQTHRPGQLQLRGVLYRPHPRRVVLGYLLRLHRPEACVQLYSADRRRLPLCVCRGDEFRRLQCALGCYWNCCRRECSGGLVDFFGVSACEVCSFPSPFCCVLHAYCSSHQWLLTSLSGWWNMGQLIVSLIAWVFLANFSCPTDSTPETCKRSENMGWWVLILFLALHP